MRRELESGIADGASHAIAALADRRVRQADHVERREAERDVDFDLHAAGLDAEDRRGPHAGEHSRQRVQSNALSRIARNL